MTPQLLFRFLCLFLFCAARPLAVAQGQSSTEPQQPNIVFILIDDLGWKDVGFMGSPFYETPHIDLLAHQGMRFMRAYAAAPICSPTRASIMTGKYPARLHLTDWLPGKRNTPEQQLLQVEDRGFLPLEETTIAERLRTAGYATAYIGKWHLGGEGHLPTDQGFDVNIGGYEAGDPGRFDGYFSPYNNPYMEDGPKGEYLTDRLSREAVQFIKAHRDEPFFLYLAHYAVHRPLQAKEEKIARYRVKAAALDLPTQAVVCEDGLCVRTVQSHPAFASMVESVDESVGRVMWALRENGLTGRTIVIFTSDNGGLSVLPNENIDLHPEKRNDLPPTSTLPLRGGKGWLYEGGLRVPLVIKWPGVVEPGSLSRIPVSSVDFFPTLLEMAGRSPLAEEGLDGESLVPLLKQEGGLEREALYWHYPHYHGAGAKPAGAIRKGRWKLIEFYEDGYVELYDLEEDPREQNNLAEERPEKAAALREQLEVWRRSVDAQMPVPNPNYTGRHRQE